MSMLVASISSGPAGTGASFQARLVARDATGATISGEGNAVLAADVSTLTCAIYDVDGTTPSTAVATPAVTIGTAITALTADSLWLAANPKDTTGRNFLFTVAGTTFATVGHHYWVVFTAVLTSGTTWRWRHEHRAVQVTPT